MDVELENVDVVDVFAVVVGWSYEAVADVDV